MINEQALPPKPTEVSNGFKEHEKYHGLLKEISSAKDIRDLLYKLQKFSDEYPDLPQTIPQLSPDKIPSWSDKKRPYNFEGSINVRNMGISFPISEDTTNPQNHMVLYGNFDYGNKLMKYYIQEFTPGDDGQPSTDYGTYERKGSRFSQSRRRFTRTKTSS